MKLLLKKFPNKNFEWVKECSKTQLEKIDDYIFLNISYNDFYQVNSFITIKGTLSSFDMINNRSLILKQIKK